MSYEEALDSIFNWLHTSDNFFYCSNNKKKSIGGGGGGGVGMGWGLTSEAQLHFHVCCAVSTECPIFDSSVNHAAWVKWPLLPVFPRRESKQFITRDFYVRVSRIAGRRLGIIPASTLHVFTRSLIGVHSDWPSEPSRQESLLIDFSDLDTVVGVMTSCAKLKDCAKWELLKCPATSI